MADLHALYQNKLAVVYVLWQFSQKLWNTVDSKAQQIIYMFITHRLI